MTDRDEGVVYTKVYLETANGRRTLLLYGNDRIELPALLSTYALDAKVNGFARFTDPLTALRALVSVWVLIPLLVALIIYAFITTGRLPGD